MSYSCLICGSSPTVRSHLFPRSLILQIRGAEKNLIEGDRSRAGIKISQGGHWDDSLVCEQHETSFAAADDYMARFCRRFEKAAALASSRKSYETANPRPDLLLRFAAATIWRHAASRHGIAHGLELGPYRQVIERHLFEGDSLLLDAIVGRSNIVDRHGNQIKIGLAPYRRKLLDWTVWHFSIAGFDFYMKTDKRPFPREWGPFLANNDPVTLPLIDPCAFDEIPMLQPIFAQMLKAG